MNDKLEEEAIIVYDCGFKSSDTQPCAGCPRIASAAHSCGILQDSIRFTQEEK